MSFFRDAKAYSQHSTPQAIRNQLALARIGLEPELKVLDVGCGSGATTRLMAGKVAAVVGLDNSDKMIESAAAEYKAVDNLSFVKGDAANFNLNQTFDVVTAFFSLQWVGDIGKALKNIYAHLTDNGKFCAMLPGYDFPHIAIKDVAFSAKWLPHFEKYFEIQKFYNEGFYTELLRKTGFDAEAIWSENLTTDHPMTNIEFIEYTRQWCGCYKLESPALQEAFIKDVIERLSKEPHDKDGKFVMRQQTLFLQAIKPEPELKLGVARPRFGY